MWLQEVFWWCRNVWRFCMDTFCVILVGDKLSLVYLTGVVGASECSLLFSSGGDSSFYNNVSPSGISTT